MAIIGNKFGVKLKDPEVRQEAYRQYCDHLASGYPKEAFFFDHPKHSVCFKTLDKYIRDNPDEFPSFLMQKAKALRYKYWIDEGKKIIQGIYKGGSPVVWQTCMRNIFKDIGWDREMQSNDNSELSLAHESLMKQIKSMQSPQAALEQKESELRSESNPPEYMEQKGHVEEDSHHF